MAQHSAWELALVAQQSQPDVAFEVMVLVDSLWQVLQADVS